MASLKGVLLAGCLAFGTRAHAIEPRADSQPRYRISPIDGSKIALPTQEQLAMMDKEVGMLIHYEIATYINIDGCNSQPNLVPNITLFDPNQLDTQNWVQSMQNLGAKWATLVAKHNCGFTMWPTKTNFSTTDGKTMHYDYAVDHSPFTGRGTYKGPDIVAKFAASAGQKGIGRGFYYSVNVNNYLNVRTAQAPGTSEFTPGTVAPNPGPGQIPITQDTYNKIVLDQLTELWSQYGPLTEIWFDGGYSASEKQQLQVLLQKYQPNAVIFNGCTTGGDCVSPHSIRWAGNEEGIAAEENWSTGTTNDGGDPESPIFCPSECDTTLQTGTRWFWGVDQPLRSLPEMIDVYHKSVGRNCLLELDLTPDRSGSVPAAHATRYKELGDFIKICYGKPIATGRDYRSKPGEWKTYFSQPVKMDRVVLMEDQTNGQVVRSFNVYAKTTQKPKEYTLLSKGQSIGHKRIVLLDQEYEITELFVNTTYVDVPKWRRITVHLCDQ